MVVPGDQPASGRTAFDDMVEKLRSVEGRLRQPDVGFSKASSEAPFAHPILKRRLRAALTILEGLLDPGSPESRPALSLSKRPGGSISTWLELARVAAAEAQGSDAASVSIESLVLHAPALFDAARVVQVIVMPASADTRLAEIFTQLASDATAAWVLHAEAFIPLSAPSSRASIVAPAEIQLAIGKEASESELESARATVPALVRLWLAPDEALGEVGGAAFPGPPTLTAALDCALGLLSLLRRNPEPPARLSSIRLMGVADDPTWCRVSRAGAIELRTDGGRLVAELVVGFSPTVSSKDPVEGSRSAPRDEWAQSLGSFPSSDWHRSRVGSPFDSLSLATGGSLDLVEESPVGEQPVEVDESVELEPFDDAELASAPIEAVELDISDGFASEELATTGLGARATVADSWTELPPVGPIDPAPFGPADPSELAPAAVGESATPSFQARPDVPPKWVPVLPLVPRPETRVRAGWLVVSDDLPFGVRLAERLLAAQHGCTVRGADELDVEAWRKVIAKLKGRPEPNRGVVFFVAGAGVPALLDRAVRNLSNITRVVLELADAERIRVFIVAAGTPDAAPMATVWAIGERLALEHAESFGGLVSVDPSVPFEVSALQVATELLDPDGERIVRLTREGRFASRAKGDLDSPAR
ncbi:MAG: hypothetical protein HYV07_25310 [Deltaproteobacteria bacterium]|nr:hypothetical protein [Deltaproteobacteria bacterium]